MDRPLRVLQLVGSPTSEFMRELSELYASGCMEALDRPERREFVIAHVSPDGLWRFPVSLSSGAVAQADRFGLDQALAKLAELRIDIALPQMFCKAGMTHYRALLDLIGIPYVGNEPLQMAIAADKALTKAIVQAVGVRVPPGETVAKGSHTTIRPPVVVKPNDSDNSEGVSLVRNDTDLAAALDAAFVHSPSAIVEQYVELGREVRCGIVAKDGELICLPLEEYFVDTVARPIRTRADKLMRTDQNALYLSSKDKKQSWIVPMEDAMVPAVWDAARACHMALGCRHYSLFDFRIDPDGRPWFIEAGPYCSFSPQSVIVTMMTAHGVSLDDFFETMIAQTLGSEG